MMRISSNRKSRDCWWLHFRECPVIFLDGIPIKGVIEADDVNGYVVVEAQENGRPKVDNGQFVTERRTGEVKIVGERLVPQ